MTGLDKTGLYQQNIPGYLNPGGQQRTIGRKTSAYNAPQYGYFYQSGQNPVATDVNAAMRSQVMPVSKNNPGYAKVMTFKVPFLNSKGNFYMLDNGQGVIIIPKEGPTTIKTFVKAGSFNERKNRGISHYIEHNLFNGSKDLAPNQFVEEVTGMGGIYNASTDTADTDYFIQSPLHEKGDLEKFLTMHANLIHFPQFTDKMLAKEKGPVISEIQMYQDDPYDNAYNTMIKSLFGIKADYQGLIAGSSKIIQNLKRDDVVNYYNEHYRPDNMLTVIVGDVNPDKTINIASKLLNRKKAASPKDQSKPVYYEPLNITEKTVRKDITSPQINSAVLAMGMAGPKNNDIKDTLATIGLVNALTGYKNARLTKAMEQYNADVNVDMGIISPNYNAPQLIEVSANFNPGQEEKGLKTIYSVLHGLKKQPVSQEEMFIVKNQLKNQMLSASESSMNVADMVGSAVVGHGDLNSYTNIEKHIENLTPQDIQRAAQKYINLDRASIVMIHPESQIKGIQDKKVAFSGNLDKFKLNHVKEYTLPNNLHVAINDNPNAIKTSANLKLKTDDIKTLKPGVADIFSEMLNKGTKNYPEEQFNQLNDVYNLGIMASADGKSINITADCPKERLPMALGVMKEVLYNPDLSEEKFEKAKEKIKLVYSSVPKNPADKAMETLYPDYLWGQTSRKVLENIDKVTLNDVKNLHSQILTDSQGVVTIDGPVSSTPGLGQAVFAQLQSGIGVNKPYHSELIPESNSPDHNIVIAEPEKRSQADIIQMFKVKESGNIKDHASLLLLNEVLGGNSNSRLFTDLRETQKLAYKVKSIYSSDGKYGNIALTIKTTTEDDLKGACYDNLKKSLNGFRKHVNNLITTPVEQKELDAAKRQVKTDLNSNMEYSSGRADRLQSGFNTLYGAEYNNSLYDAIEKLTPQDIQNAAKAFLDKPSVISLIASPGTIKNTKNYLNSLGELRMVNSN